MNVCIKGIGVVGRFGCGIESLEEAVVNPVRHEPELVKKIMGMDEAPVAVPVIPADTAMLGRFVPPKALRRVDHHSRMAILAACLALQDARQDAGPNEDLPEPMGVIVATGMGPTAGALDSQSPGADALDLHLSPIQFSNSVHNAAAAYLSILLKIRGPNISINQYDMSVPLAFQTAMDWLEEGRAASVLVGGVDCSSNDICGRHPFPAGEGSAFFVLTLSGAKEIRYPFIRDVRIGRSLQELALPSGALWVHNGTSEHIALAGSACRQAVFSHIYGVFPSGMVLDLAVAALLLKKENSRDGVLPNGDCEPELRETPRICCLKKGAAGDFGVIEVKQIQSDA